GSATAADHSRGPFPFAGAGLSTVRGVKIVVFAAHIHIRECYRQNRAAFEAARRFRIAHDSGNASAFGDGDSAVGFDGSGNGSGKILTGGRSFGTDWLIHNHGNWSVRGNDERFRRGRFPAGGFGG